MADQLVDALMLEVGQKLHQEVIFILAGTPIRVAEQHSVGKKKGKFE